MAHSALPRVAAALALATTMLAPPTALAVTIDWVTVGAPNAADTRYMNCGPSRDSSCGAVAYTYNIGKYEVTNAQYAEFLNKVAAADPNELYDQDMDPTAHGGITRSGSPGSYSYAAKSGFENKPVAFVSFWDAARFSNWLNNGQPTGAQSSLTTEDGAYTLTPEAMAANSVLRNVGAIVFLPSENEWYKAAYYDPIANLYYDYPTGTNAVTGCVVPGGDTGNSANCWPATAPMGARTDVGAYALSDSPNGTFDQGGNLEEWTEQIKWGSDRGTLGGVWYADSSNLAAEDSYGNAVPSYFNDGIGFRVASVGEPSAPSIPEPSASLLFGTGLLVSVRAFRRRSR